MNPGGKSFHQNSSPLPFSGAKFQIDPSDWQLSPFPDSGAIPCRSPHASHGSLRPYGTNGQHLCKPFVINALDTTLTAPILCRNDPCDCVKLDNLELSALRQIDMKPESLLLFVRGLFENSLLRMGTGTTRESERARCTAENGSANFESMDFACSRLLARRQWMRHGSVPVRTFSTFRH